MGRVPRTKSESEIDQDEEVSSADSNLKDPPFEADGMRSKEEADDMSEANGTSSEAEDSMLEANSLFSEVDDASSEIDSNMD